MGRIIKKGFFWGQKGLLKLWGITVGFVLTLLYGCGREWATAAYGCPHADYKIKGKVTSSKTGKGIAGIEVSSYADTVKTDSLGEYYLETSDGAGSLELRFEDRDSSDGLYVTKDTLIEFDSTDLKEGEGSWYMGTFERDVDIRLDPQ